MSDTMIEVGDEVTDSPVGEGKVTGFDSQGFPQVNGNAVSYFVRKDGKKFGAFGSLDTPIRRMVAEHPAAHEVKPMTTQSTSAEVPVGQRSASAPTETQAASVAPMTTTNSPGLTPGAAPAAPPAATPATPAPATPAAPAAPAAPTAPAKAGTTSPNTQGSPTPTVGETRVGGDESVSANANLVHATPHPASHAVPTSTPGIEGQNNQKTFIPTGPKRKVATV